jgi:hypothetical protein
MGVGRDDGRRYFPTRRNSLATNKCSCGRKIRKNISFNCLNSILNAANCKISGVYNRGIPKSVVDSKEIIIHIGE